MKRILEIDFSKAIRVPGSGDVTTAVSLKRHPSIVLREDDKGVYVEVSPGVEDFFPWTALERVRREEMTPTEPSTPAAKDKLRAA